MSIMLRGKLRWAFFSLNMVRSCLLDTSRDLAFYKFILQCLLSETEYIWKQKGEIIHLLRVTVFYLSNAESEGCYTENCSKISD